MLKYANGFTVLLPSIGVVVGYMISFTLMGFALKVIPLNVAYAIWSGLGLALTTVVSLLLFGEELNLLAVLALALIVAGVVSLSGAEGSSRAEEKRHG